MMQLDELKKYLMEVQVNLYLYARLAEDENQPDLGLKILRIIGNIKDCNNFIVEGVEWSS